MLSFLLRSAWIAKSTVSLVGLAGLATIVALPASAQNASVGGAATFTTPAGFVTSASGEMVAPGGTYFQGELVVIGLVGSGTFSAEDAELLKQALLPDSSKEPSSSALNAEPSQDSASSTNLSGGGVMLIPGRLAPVPSPEPSSRTMAIAPSTLKGEVIETLSSLDPNAPAQLDAYTAILKAATGADGLE